MQWQWPNNRLLLLPLNEIALSAVFVYYVFVDGGQIDRQSRLLELPHEWLRTIILYFIDKEIELSQVLKHLFHV